MPAGLPDVASGVVDIAIGYLSTEVYVLSGWIVQRFLTKARYSQGDVIIQLLSELVFFSLARRNVCGDRQNRYCCPGWEQAPGSRTCTKRESLNADKRTSNAKQLVAPVQYEPVFTLQRFVLVAVAAADASDLTSVSAETASSVPPVNKTPVSTLSIIHL